jgi:tetratricopeptide (TPR) repeat protein
VKNKILKFFFISTVCTCACYLGIAQESRYHQQFQQSLIKAKGVEKAEILQALITMYAANDPEKHAYYIQELYTLGKNTKNVAIQIIMLTERANVLRKKSYRDSAKLVLFHAAKLAETLEEKALIGQVAIRLGTLYDDLDETDSSLYYFERSGKYYRIAGELHTAALTLAYQGSIYRSLGKNMMAGLYLDSASQIIDQVIKTDSSYWPVRFAAVIANYQGIYFNTLGQYEKSLAWSLKAIKLFEKIGDIRGQAATLIDTGHIYRKLSQYPAALLQYRRAENTFKKIDDKNGIGVSYQSKAMAFEDIKEIDSAILYFDKALAIAGAAGNKITLGTLMNNKGAMYYNLKDYVKAKEYYEKAFAIRGGVEKASLYHFGSAMINLGQTALKTGDMKLASNYLHKGLRAAHQLQAREYEKSALEGLIEYYRATKNFQKALDYQDTLIVIKDSLFVADSKTRIAEMQVKYETEKKEQQIALLQIEKYAAELKQLGWMIGLMLTVIILILVYYTLRNRKARIQAELLVTRKEKELIEGQLNYKDKELVNFATYITEKNDFLENVLERLDSVDMTTETGKKQLDQLMPLIRDNINLNGSREEFNAHLTTVYESFIKKLDDRYPDLTDHEKRLATLLRVNLTSKQIASVFNISPKSVDMGRYRLRKKMGLHIDQDINQLLNEI